MKRKDILSFIGMLCYIILVFGGLCMYLSRDKMCDYHAYFSIESIGRKVP